MPQVRGLLLAANLGLLLQQMTVNDTNNSMVNETCTYGYDDLARLTSGNCTGTNWAQAASYDAGCPR